MPQEPGDGVMGRHQGTVGVAVAAVGVCALLAGLSRFTLNPDGVSYLDLAARLGVGDYTHFIQGYWSPLYPTLIALCTALGLPVSWSPWLINALAIAAVAVLFWTWSTRHGHALFGISLFGVLLLCGAGPPQVEAVTPDMVLLALIAWYGYELIVHSGQRWKLSGALLGLAFLAKTSLWPWMLISLGVIYWRASSDGARTAVTRSALVAAAIASLWIVPLSVKEHHFTLGSTGRLNYCWYLLRCDSRSPDTDTGAHQTYRMAAVGNEAFTVAEFDNSNIWTYQPWSDPTEWARGLQNRKATSPGGENTLNYWVGNVWQALLRWLWPIMLLVLAPLVILRRKLHSASTAPTDRNALTVTLIGVLGVMQFLAVHAEPRLLAPFVLLAGVGVVAWSTADISAAAKPLAAIRKRDRRLLLAPAFIFIAYISVVRARQDIAAGAENRRFETALDQARGTAITPRIAVVGPAFSLEAMAFALHGRIVAQVLPRAGIGFWNLTEADRAAFLENYFAGRADVVWMTTPDGKIQARRLGGKM